MTLPLPDFEFNANTIPVERTAQQDRRGCWTVHHKHDYVDYWYLGLVEESHAESHFGIASVSAGVRGYHSIAILVKVMHACPCLHGLCIL